MIRRIQFQTRKPKRLRTKGITVKPKRKTDNHEIKVNKVNFKTDTKIK